MIIVEKNHFGKPAGIFKLGGPWIQVPATISENRSSILQIHMILGENQLTQNKHKKRDRQTNRKTVSQEQTDRKTDAIVKTFEAFWEFS